MSKTIDRIYMQSGLAKLFPPRLAEMTFSAPREDSEAEMLAQRPAADAWHTWWVERNGDAALDLATPEGRLGLESCIAFRAGWKQANSAEDAL